MDICCSALRYVRIDNRESLSDHDLAPSGVPPKGTQVDNFIDSSLSCRSMALVGQCQFAGCTLLDVGRQRY